MRHAPAIRLRDCQPGQSVVNACKKAYRKMDIYEIHSIAKTASIAIYMEDQQKEAA